MPFTMDAEVGAAIAAIMGGQEPPKLPAGDVNTRREMLNGLFSVLTTLSPTATDVDTKDVYARADDGHEVLCRWYTKANAKPPGSAIVYAHGGGYIALSLSQYDDVIKRYVSRTGVPFLGVDYRYAPEHKAPIPVTDTYAGLRYLVSHASELGVDPGRISIMGDSGGGGVTASLAHYLKLRGGPVVKKQILIYPMLDDRNTHEDPHIAPYATWSTDDNITGWGALLGDRAGKDGVDPIEAAGRMTVQDARALPPAYIEVGELDIFRDENLEYARKLGLAGVECEFHLMPQLPHAHEGFAPESRAARTSMENRCRVIGNL